MDLASAMILKHRCANGSPPGAWWLAAGCKAAARVAATTWDASSWQRVARWLQPKPFLGLGRPLTTLTTTDP